MYRHSPEKRVRHIEEARAWHKRRKKDPLYRLFRKVTGDLGNYRRSLEFHQNKVNEMIHKITITNNRLDKVRAQLKAQRKKGVMITGGI